VECAFFASARRYASSAGLVPKFVQGENVVFPYGANGTKCHSLLPLSLKEKGDASVTLI
jgi:hypothetical protein